VSEIPDDLRPLVEAMVGKTAEDLFQAWHRGVCDGLEMAARMTETLLPHLGQREAHEIVLGLGLAIRQSQMRVQVDAADDNGSQCEQE
jgi:hypothetical protein